MSKTLLRLTVVCAALVFGADANAATCGNTGAGFNTWLAQFKSEASRYRLNPRVVESALSGVTYNTKVIGFDRNQKSFRLSFEQFYARRVNNAMINQGKRLIQQNRRLFDQIERRYGVPAPIIVAIWGLETGYGRNSGNMSVMRSLATLAYDCRRTEFFTNELVAALTIVQRGDMQPSQMRGAWAGEIGQTQFLASSYVKYAVDFDGDRRRDLIRSVPDVLASTANYLQKKGWRRGQPWGPGTANYEVIRRWNKASVYVKTISVMAEKIAS